MLRCFVYNVDYVLKSYIRNPPYVFDFKRGGGYI